MIEASAEVEIAASPEEIWRIMTDTAHESAWMRAVRTVEFVGRDGGYETGRRMRRSRFLGFGIAWESEISEVIPARRLVFRHVAGALRGESRWEIDPLAAGSRVRLVTKGPAAGVLAWAPALATAATRLGLRSDLARLKRLAEAA
jgi:uncharacterized protein YndB with AHSA1/START domain